MKIPRTVYRTVYPTLLLTVIVVLFFLAYVLHRDEFVPRFFSDQALVVLPSPQLSAPVWGVFNPETGEIYGGSRIHEPRPIASVTKLFTAYGVVTEDTLTEPVVINWSDLNTEGDAGKLTYGEKLTQGELLFPLLLESSNDAGAALERSLGTSLTGNVNALIHSLALTDTELHDPTGLSQENVSSVTDLARFYAYLHTTYPYLTDITQLKMYLGPSEGWVNNNPLREYAYFTGGKHGFTPEAGRTFVGSFRTSTGTEVGVVLLGSEDLESDMRLLAASLNIE